MAAGTVPIAYIGNDTIGILMIEAIVLTMVPTIIPQNAKAVAGMKSDNLGEKLKSIKLW